ncbi:MAG: DUF3987 domain-containing protein [Planctomycetes bacterium]|nr:DUF3987 domain-containing protein [Planctomycetota bacterium]
MNRRPRSPRKAKRAFRSADAAAGALLQTAELRGATITKYAYSDNFTVARFDFEDGRDKGFRPIHKAGSGWVIGDPPGLLPLFCIDKVSECVTVYVVEGERCAHAGWNINLPTVTSAHGSHSPHRSDWSPLAGKSVVILSDNDNPGRRYAETVAGILHELGCSVKTVVLPELPDGGDIVDWADKNNGKSPAELRALIEQLAVDAPEWKPPVAAETSDTKPAPALDWKPFPVAALPEPMRSFVVEHAAAIGCDESMLALPALGSCAGAIGTTRMLYLKRDWIEPAILWLLVVSRSGSLKTPAYKHSLRPLYEAQRVRFREYDAAIEAFEREMNRYDSDLNLWKKAKLGERGEQPNKPAPPVCVRYLVDQTTLEALAPILCENPRGVLLARDESSGWVRGMNEYKGGKGSDLSNWLQMYDAGTVIVDRKTGRQTIHIPRAAVSVTGTIQPDTLREVLTPELFACGFAARLLLAAPPDRKIKWSEHEAPVRVIQRYAETIARLLALEHTVGQDGESEPVHLRWSPEAKAVFLEWHAEWSDRHADAPDDRTAAVLSKIKGGAARLALVLQLVADPSATAIGADAMQSGVTLARWFADEADRIYSGWTETAEGRDRRTLIEWIQRRGGAVSVRDLTHGLRRFRGHGDGAKNALQELVAAGLGNWLDEVSPKGGAPARRFCLATVTGVTVTTTPPNSTENGGSGDGDGGDGGENEVGEWAG